MDGPIEVITDVGSVFSTTSFLLPPPDCGPVTGNDHASAITFKLKKSGAAKGVVSSTEDPAFTDCAAAAPVKIQKKKKGDGWKTKGNCDHRTTRGRTAPTINAKPGKYLALAPAHGASASPGSRTSAPSTKSTGRPTSKPGFESFQSKAPHPVQVSLHLLEQSLRKDLVYFPQRDQEPRTSRPPILPSIPTSTAPASGPPRSRSAARRRCGFSGFPSTRRYGRRAEVGEHEDVEGSARGVGRRA